MNCLRFNHLLPKRWKRQNLKRRNKNLNHRRKRHKMTKQINKLTNKNLWNHCQNYKLSRVWKRSNKVNHLMKIVLEHHLMIQHESELNSVKLPVNRKKSKNAIMIFGNIMVTNLTTFNSQATEWKAPYAS